MSDKFAQLKVCAKKEIARLYFDQAGLKDITELQQHLLSKLEAKSIADLYNKDVIHVGGKKIPTQAAKIKDGADSNKWSKEDLDKYHALWKQKATTREEDMAIRNKIVTFIKKLDEEKKDLCNSAVASNKDFLSFLKNNNFRCCYSCFSQTCLIKLEVAKKVGAGFRGNRSCRRDEKGWKGWQFGHLENLKLWENRPFMKTVTVSIRPASSDPGTSHLVNDLETNWMDEITEISSQMARVTTRPRFNSRTIPKSDELLAYSDSNSKKCAICGIGGMYALDLLIHLNDDHGLEADSTVTKWNLSLIHI